MATDISFPGLGILKTQENDRHTITEGAILCDKITVRVTLMRDRMFEHLPIIIASVFTSDGKKKLWGYDDEKRAGFAGVCNIVNVDSKSLITFVGRGRDGKVIRVIPLSDIAQEVRNHDVLSGLELKKLAATALGRDVEYSPQENRVIGLLANRQRDTEAARRDEEEKRRDEQRKLRVQTILKRSDVEGYTKDGRKRYGKPVVGDDWMCLPHDTFVMQVASFDEKSGTPGKLIESFRVVREHGRNPKRGFSALVTPDMPAVLSGPSLPKKLRTVTVEKGNQFLEVDVYRNRADIDALKAAGLNSGALVGVEKNDEKDITKVSVDVFRLLKGKMETLGLCAMI